jgi:hypothetical protein
LKFAKVGTGQQDWPRSPQRQEGRDGVCDVRFHHAALRRGEACADQGDKPLAIKRYGRGKFTLGVKLSSDSKPRARRANPASHDVLAGYGEIVD